MKRILVYDVAASTSGALTILTEYYREACTDNSRQYVFVISTPEFSDTKNVKVLRYPWVKRSWLHRLWFDYIIAPKLVQKYEVSEVLSLQNTIIPRTNIAQVLYLHQSLPFIDYKFRFFENIIFWVYQNVIGILIIESINRAKQVIVQTQWMKDACVKRSGCNPTKVLVQMPKIDVSQIPEYGGQKSKITIFFYPATALIYKNHITIVKACMMLKKNKVMNYKVIFTINGHENTVAQDLLMKTAKYDLPIEFRDTISRKDVLQLYSETVLLFPSYVETLGLPLLEAKLTGAPIIAADTVFAREMLADYQNKEFFNYNSSAELSKCMINKISMGVNVTDVEKE